MQAGRARKAALISVTLVALVSTLLVLEPGSPAGTSKASAATTGIDKLDHLIFIIQENRSFDNYFGTYPGADGLKGHLNSGKITACIPDPVLGHCVRPFHQTHMDSMGGPHNEPAAVTDVNHGAMNGFVYSAISDKSDPCASHPFMSGCAQWTGPAHQPDIMGYYTGQQLYNYWTYARRFTLQDHMFESTDSWTLPSHLFLISGWAATCSNWTDPMSCHTNVGTIPKAVNGAVPYAWTDITYLLNKHNVSWGWYVDPRSCWEATCVNHGTNPDQNVLPGFLDVHQDHQMNNIQYHPAFFTQAAAGTLPSVSWVLPGPGYSEHPDAGSISPGIAWVTKVINAVMNSPDWSTSAIFLTWDDWGGYYDNVVPPKVGAVGYGLRAPGLVISPYARPGYIDHQVLSFDAYLKFIEDRFCNGQRLNPATDGRPDSRPMVRENVSILGDLTNDFNFNQTPLPPVILHPNQSPIG
jgi:phospholipase C